MLRVAGAPAIAERQNQPARLGRLLQHRRGLNDRLDAVRRHAPMEIGRLLERGSNSRGLGHDAPGGRRPGSRAARKLAANSSAVTWSGSQPLVSLRICTG